MGCISCGRPSDRGICVHHQAVYQAAWVVGERQGVLQRLIDTYKFERARSAVVELASLLDARLPLLPAATVIVPVPTASSHIRERGYDHSLLLARALGWRRSLEVAPVLKRLSGGTQHLLGRQARQQQAKAAFSVPNGLNPDVPYLIVDDIITTGATITAAAEQLTKAGAQQVWVAALAWQPLD